jgi:hypothetical protein
MRNFEKYEEEVVKADYVIGVLKDNTIKRCGEISECEDCIFYKSRNLNDCNKARIKWLYEEYVEPIKLTRLEYEVLKHLQKEYSNFKWIMRDKNNVLYIYDKYPKEEIENPVEFRYMHSLYLYLFKNCFKFVDKNNAEPYLIEDILNNYEVVE